MSITHRRWSRKEGLVLDKRDDWSEHQPSAARENRFVEKHGRKAYGRWHLGIDDDAEGTKVHYKFARP